MRELAFHPAARAEAARSFRMNTFRYSLIVVTLDGEPMVYAVTHQHRKPAYWRSRLA